MAARGAPLVVLFVVLLVVVHGDDTEDSQIEEARARLEEMVLRDMGVDQEGVDDLRTLMRGAEDASTQSQDEPSTDPKAVEAELLRESVVNEVIDSLAAHTQDVLDPEKEDKKVEEIHEEIEGEAARHAPDWEQERRKTKGYAELKEEIAKKRQELLDRLGDYEGAYRAGTLTRGGTKESLRERLDGILSEALREVPSPTRTNHEEDLTEKELNDVFEGLRDTASLGADSVPQNTDSTSHERPPVDDIRGIRDEIHRLEVERQERLREAMRHKEEVLAKIEALKKDRPPARTFEHTGSNGEGEAYDNQAARELEKMRTEMEERAEERRRAAEWQRLTKTEL